jgi:hypothetical protein
VLREPRSATPNDCAGWPTAEETENDVVDVVVLRRVHILVAAGTSVTFDSPRHFHEHSRLFQSTVLCVLILQSLYGEVLMLNVEHLYTISVLLRL